MQRLVHVGNLEHDALGDHAANGHDLTSTLAQVGYRLTISDLIFDAVLAEVVLNDGDAGA